MKKKRGKAGVSFLGGHITFENIVGLLAIPKAMGNEYEFTRFYTTDQKQWFHLHYDFDIKSVTHRAPTITDRAWWLVGKRGEVVEVKSGKSRLEIIPTAGTGRGKYGYLEKITVIDNDLYVCGYGRQVYKREEDNWVLLSAPILVAGLDEMVPGFESMDGVSGDHLFAVGDEGEIWFYDGRSWHQEDSPTNANLSDIKCIDKDNVWICGDQGIVIHGRRGQWQIVCQEDELTENWWSIESFKGEIYLAGDDVLAKVVGNGVQRVPIGKKKDVTVNWLHANSNYLLTIGMDDAFLFDGDSWIELVCPDNK